MFRSLVENSIDVVLLLNSANEIVYVSPSVTQTYGYQPEAITGTTLFDLLHAEDLIIARDALALSATDEIFGPSVVRIQHKDQSWKYVEVIGQPFSEDQSLLQLSVRDVTQLSGSSLAPREIEISFEEAFNATSSITSVTEVESGVYIKVNEAWVTNMGWSREEVIGKTAVQLGIWESDAHRKEITDNLKKQGYLKGYRTWLSNRKGERRIVLLDATYLHPPAGVRLYVTAVDITEHEETEKQLLQAQKLESIGKFTSGIAHDFNNMLSVIIGNAELLETQDDPVLASESIATILRSASNGASLIEQLLSFSREQELEPVRFTPGQQLQNMLALLQTVTRGNITLKVESAEDDWICFLDPVQFESAILNMTINAKDAMPNGGSVTYRVSKQTLEVPKAGLVTIPAGDHLQIELEDTGTGMPEQVIHHAFEPFYTTKGAAGTGLGLSMVYGFITQSGGHISIQSNSTGTTITLLVPRVKAEHT